MHETDVPPTRYHLAGMYVVLSGLTQALLTSFPPRTHGRKDDLLVHMDGNNMSAEAMQLDIRAASEVIKNAIVVGHARPCTALLVEVSENIDPNSKEIAEEI